MLDCQKCDTPCFDFEETGICHKAPLPPAVCPMFEDFSLDGISDNITAKAIVPP